MSYHSTKKSYSTNKTLNIKIQLTNNLQTPVKLEEVLLEPENPEIITLESPIQDVIQVEKLNNEVSSIFLFQPDSEYLFNVTAISKDTFSGTLGNIKIAWTDDSIQQYRDYNIMNFSVVKIDRIELKHFEISLDYKSPGTFHGKIPKEYKVHVKNNTNNFKKLIFVVDTTNTSSHFAISGNINSKFTLYPSATKVLKVNLLPLVYGKIKLPSFKFMEYPFNSEKWENKKMSVYTFPDYVLVTGEEE